MKSNNLTYGSIVRLKDSGKFVKVCNLTRKKIGYHLCERESNMHYSPLTNVEPVGICMDSLERNGFIWNEYLKCYYLDLYTKQADEEGLIDYDECVHLYKPEEGYKEWYLTIFRQGAVPDEPTRIEIGLRYLHELQRYLVMGGILNNDEEYEEGNVD